MSRELLRRVVEILKMAAALTPNKYDDRAAETLAFIANDPEVYQWVISLIDSFTRKSLKLPVSHTDESISAPVQAKLAAANIDNEVFIATLPDALAMLATLDGR